MKNLYPSIESCSRNGVIGLGLIPGHEPATFNIKVFHGHNQYQVAVPSNSNFGYLKSVMSQNVGLNLETCKIFFNGVEKQYDEDLQVAGVMNNSEVVLVEVMEYDSEKVQEIPVISKGENAVTEVRKEVDKFEQRVSVLLTAFESGNTVDGKEIIILTEMLERQLLKLDGIEAEGEGRVQRKKEVCRVQSIVETLDAMKSINSNSSSNTNRSMSSTSQSRASDSGSQTTKPSSPMPSSSDSGSQTTKPSSPMPSSASSDMPCSSPSPVPLFTPLTTQSSNYYPVPCFVPAPMPYYDPSSVPYYEPTIPYPTPYYYPSTPATPMPYYEPSPMPYASQPSPYPSPFLYFPPSHMPSSAPSSMPLSSSSQATGNWEHFD